MSIMRVVFIVAIVWVVCASSAPKGNSGYPVDHTITARVGNLDKIEVPVNVFKLQKGLTLEYPLESNAGFRIWYYEYERYDNYGNRTYFKVGGPSFSWDVLEDIQKAMKGNKIVIDGIIVTCPNCVLRKLNPIKHTLI